VDSVGFDERRVLDDLFLQADLVQIDAEVKTTSAGLIKAFVLQGRYCRSCRAS
jgi:hypothetical protein